MERPLNLFLNFIKYGSINFDAIYEITIAINIFSKSTDVLLVLINDNVAIVIT